MKTKKIVIRCTEETWRRWRVFIVSKGFRNSEEALNYLLDKVEKRWEPEAEVFSPKKC